ncbi:MAG: sugar ABC transporter permease [Devosia sp.]|uniref:carbohydrate ABC transporter permease n=1 Tax=Devosia sp. 66-22 TaxID=1895753 RepID=UPI000AE30D0F|nr:sugar ABC transporter permease [Devosia sp. 66-22]MBN9348478.1 sugar ABC transporter permease [Devosia sp.]
MITKRPLVAIGFLLPALTAYGLFTLYPLVRGLWLSLTDSSGGPRSNFIGLENYRRLIFDPDVHSATLITIQYAVIVVVLQNLFGLLLARALFERPHARRVIGTLVLLPTLVAPLMSSFIFSYLLAPDGALNRMLALIGLPGLQHVWYGDPTTALASIAAVQIWMYTGYTATIFLAGYLAIPRELLEAGRIDGATSWQQFRLIEWPLLAPSLTVCVTLSLIGSLRVFEFPFVLTNGGPAGSTMTLTLLIFNSTFHAASKFAYGIAIAFALLVLVVVSAAIATVVLRAREARI